MGKKYQKCSTKYSGPLCLWFSWWSWNFQAGLSPHLHHPQRGLPSGAYLVAQTVKNPPAMQETQVQFLGWEDPLKKGMATDSSILAWRIPRAKESGGLQAMELQRVGHNWVIKTYWGSPEIPESPMIACAGPGVWGTIPQQNTHDPTSFRKHLPPTFWEYSNFLKAPATAPPSDLRDTGSQSPPHT